MIPFFVVPTANREATVIGGARKFTYSEGPDRAFMMAQIQTIEPHADAENVSVINYGGNDVYNVFVPFERLMQFLVERMFREPMPDAPPPRKIIETPGLVISS